MQIMENPDDSHAVDVEVLGMKKRRYATNE